MKALILAAGVGKRLKANVPKILLKVGNKSLLERHYENLLNLGIKNIGIVIGYKSNQLTNFIKKIDIKKNIKIFRNPRYKLGSIVSLVCADKFFHIKGDLIFMDGDVFYDKKVLKKLINSKKKNCLLIDRQFEKGEEPVKVCIKNNKIFDFGKIVNQDFDFQGESVGFFKFSNKSSIKSVSSLGLAPMSQIIIGSKFFIKSIIYYISYKKICNYDNYYMFYNKIKNFKNTNN